MFNGDLEGADDLDDPLCWTQIYQNEEELEEIETFSEPSPKQRITPDMSIEDRIKEMQNEM